MCRPARRRCRSRSEGSERTGEPDAAVSSKDLQSSRQLAAGSWQPTARCPLPAESVRGHVWHVVKSERVAFVVEQPDIRLRVAVEHQVDGPWAREDLRVL